MNSTKYNDHVLMIKDLFCMMVFIRLLIFTKTVENRFSRKRFSRKGSHKKEILAERKRFSEILKEKKRFSEVSQTRKDFQT